MPTLSEEIASEAETIALDYPKGATMTDLAGYFGAPLRDVQRAVDRLRADGTSLPFLKDAPKKQEPWEPRETHTINAQCGEREGPHPNKRGRTHPEQLADQVRYRLTELAKAFPLGCTVPQFQEFFELDLQHAYAVIRTLEHEGDAVSDWTLEQPRQKIVYVRGMREAPPPLTELQERVYNHILQLANGETRVVVNYAQTAQATKASIGSVPQICFALERKGYLWRISPYYQGGDQEKAGGRINGQRSPEYEIRTPELEDPMAHLDAPAPKGVKPHPRVPAKIRDDGAVKRAIARRAELVRGIEQIDAFLQTFADLTK